MKYYYFYYRYNVLLFFNEFGCGTCRTEGTSFPLSDALEEIMNKENKSAVISFWREITEEEYEKVDKLMKLR